MLDASRQYGTGDKGGAVIRNRLVKENSMIGVVDWRSL
jgi:hypothetical protein